MRVLAFLFALATTAGPALASPQSDVMATVNRFVKGFNAGDMKAVLAACGPKMLIIDDFAPHVWSGATACSDWSNAYDADAKRQGITDGFVALGKPWRVDVTGDRAYEVVPATYTYKQRGKPVNETGAVLTVALWRVGSVWLMTGWAWSRH